MIGCMESQEKGETSDIHPAPSCLLLSLWNLPGLPNTKLFENSGTSGFTLAHASHPTADCHFPCGSADLIRRKSRKPHRKSMPRGMNIKQREGHPRFRGPNHNSACNSLNCPRPCFIISIYGNLTPAFSQEI